MHEGDQGKAAWQILLFADRSRVVYRLSGTGTRGNPFHVYLERIEPDAERQSQDPQVPLFCVCALVNPIQR